MKKYIIIAVLLLIATPALACDLKGDANRDGKVDGLDYQAIDTGFLFGLSGWENGDFNGDGKITASDYFIIDQAFQRGDSCPIVIASQVSSFTTPQFSVRNNPNYFYFNGIWYSHMKLPQNEIEKLINQIIDLQVLLVK